MDKFIQLTMTGLTNGAIIALVALGFVLIYKASDVINFAQGDLLMVGAYITYAFIAQFGLPWSIGVLLALIAAVGLGMTIERLILRPMIGQPTISVIMVTIGLSSVLRAIVGLIWGTIPRSFPPFLPTHGVEVLGAIVPADRLVAIGLAATLLIVFSVFFNASREGIAMRAAADDQQASLSMGISVRKMFALAWSIAACAAVIAGMLVANTVGVSTLVSGVGLRVFPVVILGGLDSIPGAIIAAVIMGLLEAYTGGYIGGGLSQVIPFVVLILLLMVRPYGLFGQLRVERV